MHDYPSDHQMVEYPKPGTFPPPKTWWDWLLAIFG